MVATRRGAKAAADSAPVASSTLNAPPKRAKKRVEEEAAEPASSKNKPTKTTSTKRKAVAEPEAAEPPAKKKTVTTGRATRGTKVETEEEPPSAPAPKRATRSRKVEEPTLAAEEDNTVAAPKSATTRGRKAPAKKAAAPKIEESVETGEVVPEEMIKSVTQTRKTSTRKMLIKKTIAKEPALPVIEETAVAEPVEETKPAPRGCKAAAPKPAPVPTLMARATRGRNIAVLSQESPLKAPPRKLAKKSATTTTTKSQLQSIRKPAGKPDASAVTNEDVVQPNLTTQAMAEFPQYPATPAHIVAPVTAKEAFSELPEYPQTPAHIVAPITSQAALVEMPEYPQTPAHIIPPVSNQDALVEMAGYPQTPAHINAPITSQAALAEMPGYPKTPAYIVAPISYKDALAELPEYPKTPAHIIAPITSQAALAEMPGYPKTPAYIVAPVSNKDALAELPDYPKTPTHISVSQVEEKVKDSVTLDYSPSFYQKQAQAPVLQKENNVDGKVSLRHLPINPQMPSHVVASVANAAAVEALLSQPNTPAYSKAPLTTKNALNEPPKNLEMSTQIRALASQSERKPLAEVSDLSKSPYHNSARHLVFQNSLSSPPDVEGTPSHLMSSTTSIPAKQNSQPTEPPETSPRETLKDITNQEAFAQLPEYPRTPTHTKAPITTKDALAELPSFPNTPALIMEAAIQAEISASVKKQSPSPSHFAHLSEHSVDSVDPVDSSFASIGDPMEVDNEPLPAASTLKLAPLKLIPTGPLPPNPFQSVPAPLDLGPPVPALVHASVPASPTKSILRSPQKMDLKTPKKAVTWEDDESPDRSELFMHGGPLQGMTFYIDVISNGMNQSFLFSTLIEDLGAKVKREWHPKVTHVLFKNGSKTTLRHVLASNGAVRCMNIGWVLDCEEQGRRVEIEPYLVDLSASAPSPVPQPGTPSRTPSRLALPPSSDIASRPSTPTSSEFDRSFHEDDNKENSGPVHSLFETFANGGKLKMRTQPVNRVKRSFLFDRSPIKTPTRLNFLNVSPVKGFSTGKKQNVETMIGGIRSAPPKKLKFVRGYKREDERDRVL